jgi:hypothetical protein
MMLAQSGGEAVEAAACEKAHAPQHGSGDVTCDIAARGTCRVHKAAEQFVLP